MKNLRYYSLMAALTAAMTIGFTSCGSDDDNNGSGSTATVAGTQQAMQEACDSWRGSRAYWELSEAFLFGPADEYNVDPHIDTWPVAANSVAEILRDEKIMARIDQYLIEQQDDNVLGFHGLEYLLFRDGAARNVSQITNVEYKMAVAIAKDLYASTCVLETAWAGPSNVAASHKAACDTWLANRKETYKNYGDEFRSMAGVDAAVQILEGCIDITNEVSGSKIGLPYTGEDVSYIESPFARNSITDFRDNIISCRNALYGGVGATTPQTTSLMYFCLNSGNATLATQAREVQEDLEYAIEKVAAMKAPFVLYYKDSSAQEAMGALDVLIMSIEELEKLLKAASNNSAVEAACKNVRDQYVQNVVIPTYRMLVENTEQLLNKVTNISAQK
jgi:hypothetical protein